ncbi:MAG: IS4 family transposase [Candidatus Auribacterota bacterium]|nr:IS4 family transposase [Candidatus Auribacterota bacterium]
MHHHNILLGQMLQMFSRYEFQKAVSETKTEYHARGFSSWNHFVAMLFGQLSGQDSLRGIEAGLATQAACLYHAGVGPVHRSTLAYANEHRSHELFKKIFMLMLSKCKPWAPKHKFRFKNPLYSIDATAISLCLSLYNWAKFHRTKGAVKLHVKLNHSGYLPSFMVVTHGKINEQTIAPHIPLEKGDVAVFDRGYNNLDWYKALDDKGVYFVTRLKFNADFKVLKRRPVNHLKNIYSDQIIKLRGPLSRYKFTSTLRRIRSRDPETGKIIVILTNNMDWSAKTIAAIYKERWQIELFFRAIKQQLRVKSFVGTSKNALLSQLWIALTAYLLLSYLKFKSRFNWSLNTLISILPTNLFARRNLWDWLNAPFHERSNAPPHILQQEFSFR